MHTLPQDPSFVKHYRPCLHGFNTIHDNTLSLWLLEGHVVCIEQSVFCVSLSSGAASYGFQLLLHSPLTIDVLIFLFQSLCSWRAFSGYSVFSVK